MSELQLLVEFIKDILKAVGLNEQAREFDLERGDLSAQTSAEILQRINSFMYVTDPSIGRNTETGKEFISRFHKFWKTYHQEIINPIIDEESCNRVAGILESIPAEHTLFASGDVTDLTPNQIANVRFFTITQDFKIRFRVDPYSLMHTKPYLFDPQTILGNYPSATDELLNELGAQTQTDKRHKFSQLSAELLVENYQGEALNMCQTHHNNVLEIRQALVDNSNPKFKNQLGFSDKKANLFIRDLVAMGVWRVTNPEELDVSSDQNTMRIALRTGILKTRYPLLTSYLDVYDHQYGLVDKYNRLAWRKVWEDWGTITPNHRVPAPAMFDFLIYRIGQNCCKPKQRRCYARCNPERLARCQLKSSILTNCSGLCVFDGVCPSANRKLNPPRAISIYGGTGWEDGRTDEGGGKGISS